MISPRAPTQVGPQESNRRVACVAPGGAGDHRRPDRPRPGPVVARCCPGRLPGRARRVRPGPAADRRPVLARVDRRAGADQPAPRTASPAPGAGRRAFARGDAQGPVLARTPTTCRVDVRVFETERRAALAAAAAGTTRGSCATPPRRSPQYRGDLLPGGYDDWLLDARAELERQCVDLCDLLVRGAGPSGDLAGAVEAARRRVQLQPLEEAGYRTLMRLQADLGDRAGAVSTYHHCASVLERELGVVPDPATRQAFQRLMARRPPGRAARRAPSPRAGPARPGGGAALRPVRRARPAAGRVAGRRWPAAAASCWSAAAPASGRPGWSPRSPRWRGCRAPWSRAPSASGRRGGWRWPRWRTGCATPRSSRRRRPSTPPGAPKSAG